MQKDNFYENKRIYEDGKRKNDERILNSSKKKLTDAIVKRIRTTMIGAIAELERSEFGKIFGFGKTKLTEEERKWKMIWDEVRTNILNQGNNQLRECQREIEQYETRFKPYHTDFIVRRNTNDR